MQGGGLSVPTLVIASLSSLAAALFIHKFWPGGAILGAAVTPIIVALVSEMLRKPVTRFETLREERRDRARRGRETFGPPPPLAEDPRREDPFGIWGAETRGGLVGGRLNARHVKIALATGIAAFVLVSVGLTALELVGGGSAGGDSRTTIFGGKDRDADREQRDRDARQPAATETQPEEIPETTPEETEEPIEPGTVTEPPAQTTPEGGTPAPEQSPAPAPAPTP